MPYYCVKNKNAPGFIFSGVQSVEKPESEPPEFHCPFKIPQTDPEYEPETDKAERRIRSMPVFEHTAERFQYYQREHVGIGIERGMRHAR